MKKKVTLITGSCGEMGQALIRKLKNKKIITLDIESLDLISKSHIHYTGSILDSEVLNKINLNYQIEEIYHLAAILSTKAEKNPALAKQVNITGTQNIYNLCLSQIDRYNNLVKIFFPSSIAVYNILGANINYAISEKQHCIEPYTIYGQSKLISEKEGIKLSESNKLFDFRCIRFPGIISSETMPTGGTSDYASEMIHAAMNDQPYSCFVDNHTILPFMVMPDAISAMIQLIESSKHQLKSAIYNVTSFSPSALDIEMKIKAFFPDFEVKYDRNNDRQKIVNSWPNNINDSCAKKDWLWNPQYDFNSAFNNYIIPNLFEHYEQKDKS
tara:strand:+ start:232 stop:1215 length:984 start_codon:yes stop_codon:yes gene_type:complete